MKDGCFRKPCVNYHGFRSFKTLLPVQLDQLRNQLSQGYEARVWTANEVKTPNEEQLRSENSQEMQ